MGNISEEAAELRIWAEGHVKLGLVQARMVLKLLDKFDEMEVELKRTTKERDQLEDAIHKLREKTSLAAPDAKA